MTVAAARSVTGQVNIDDIRRAFVAALGSGELKGMGSWPWIRAMLQDPNELIVDDDDGGLWRVPYVIENENVNFSDPQAVKIQYVNAQALKQSAERSFYVAGMLMGREVAASYGTREESLALTTQEDHTMTPEQQALRANLGLPADATDAQVMAKVSATLTAAAEVPSPDQVPLKPESPAHGPGSPPEAQPATPEAATQANPEGEQVITQGDVTTTPGTTAPGNVTAAAIPPGMSLVPTAAWTNLQGTVATLHKSHQDTEKVNRGQVLVAAIRDGRIPPAQHDYYQSKLDDPNTRDAFMHLLTASADQGGLMPGLVPTEQRSIEGAFDGSAELYPQAWFPELAEAAAPTGPISMEA